MRPRFHILRGLAESFTALDPAYKSHSKVRIGVKGLPKRVIFSFGHYCSGYGFDQFRDMVNALAAVRGQAALEWCEIQAMEADHKAGEDATFSARELMRFKAGRGDEAILVPDRGITVRKFANGNAHVFFDRDSLLAINTIAAVQIGGSAQGNEAALKMIHDKTEAALSEAREAGDSLAAGDRV